MKIIKNLTFEEYIYWYLQREFSTKRNRNADNPKNFKTIEEMKTYMFDHHGGKIREWFPFAKFFLVEIANLEYLDTFVCLHSRDLWAQELIPEETQNKEDFRILGTVIQNLKNKNYFRESCDDYEKRHKYFNQYKELPILPPLRDNHKIVLCSLNNSEKKQNPSASYYLHDGLGRLLTYRYLNKFNNKSIPLPIEAIVIEKINL